MSTQKLKKLILAEKPKVAQAIAAATGRAQRKDGYLENDLYVITWAYGHLLSLYDAEDYNPKYKEWRIEDLPIIPEVFKYKLSGRSGIAKHFKVIKTLMNRKDIESVINACDSGREGELIFHTIYNYAGCKLPIERLWISSQTTEAIRKGLAALRPGHEFNNLRDESFCRQEADWLIGINGTRAFSTRNNAKVIIGRVQTPTLALIVNRELEIRSFKPETFYRIRAFFETEGGMGYEGWWFKGDDNSIATLQEAEAIANKVDGNPGVVIDVQTELKEEKPPLLFDLGSLQQQMNRRYGFSAAKTLEIAQELYETHRLITYPRTDSRFLSDDLIPQLKKALNASKDVLPSEARQVLGSKLAITERIVNNKRVSDHHAIIPTGEKVDLGKLSQDERRVYEEIVRRFVAAFYPPYVYTQMTIITQVEDELFQSRGREINDDGWRALYAQDTKNSSGNEDGEDDLLPPLAVDDNVYTIECVPEERQTQPPRRYTEATLLADMERAGKFIDDDDMRKAVQGRGIGTPATRANIIERLIRYQYIERNKRTLSPTETGIALILGLKHETLKSPELTAQWEMQLQAVREGKLKRQEFMRQIVDMTKSLVDLAQKDGLISGIGMDAESDSSALGNCPLCAKPVKAFARAYTCGDRECSFFIMKQIAGKNITANIARTLIRDGATGTLKGFKSRKGTNFNARLKLNDRGQVEFDFASTGK